MKTTIKPAQPRPAAKPFGYLTTIKGMDITLDVIDGAEDSDSPADGLATMALRSATAAILSESGWILHVALEASPTSVLIRCNASIAKRVRRSLAEGQLATRAAAVLRAMRGQA